MEKLHPLTINEIIDGPEFAKLTDLEALVDVLEFAGEIFRPNDDPKSIAEKACEPDRPCDLSMAEIVDRIWSYAAAWTQPESA